MKKRLCFVLAALVLVLCVGCGGGAEDADTTQTTKGNLTKDEAIAAAEAHWNIKSGDRDPETGYVMSVVITNFPSEENPYYRAVLRWMVEVNGEPDHPSQLDVVLVHQVTGEIVVEGEK